MRRLTEKEIKDAAVKAITLAKRFGLYGFERMTKEEKELIKNTDWYKYYYGKRRNSRKE
jgi:hypothetical protein